MRHATLITAAALLLLVGCTSASTDEPASTTTGAAVSFDEAHDEAWALQADIETASGLKGWEPLSDAREGCENEGDAKPSLATTVVVGAEIDDAAAEAALTDVAALLASRGFHTRTTDLTLRDGIRGWELVAGDVEGVDVIVNLSRHGGGTQIYGRCAPRPNTPAPGLPTPTP